MRGKLLCSSVGIKNSYKHRVQSADIEVSFRVSYELEDPISKRIKIPNMHAIL